MAYETFKEWADATRNDRPKLIDAWIAGRDSMRWFYSFDDLSKAIAHAERVETAMVAMKERAERAEAALEAMRSDGMIQRLADQQHEIWSHWMRYLFSCCAPAGDGSMLIPVEKVERWQRQMQTPYGSLSEYEQGSDINQAMKIIAVLTSDNDLLSSDEEDR